MIAGLSAWSVKFHVQRIAPKTGPTLTAGIILGAWREAPDCERHDVFGAFRMRVIAGRALVILEPFALFSLIMAYIWALRAIYPYLWILILGPMLLSHVLRRETPVRLGFGTHNLLPLVRKCTPLLGLLLLVFASCGILFRTVRPVGTGGAVAALAVYLPWGLMQQYMLNGYFLNRFGAVLPSRTAALVAAALFCAAHLPNWFLMCVTFPGGYCAARVYQRCRNLYLLGLAHALAGFLIFLFVPDSISHHLRVGPAWFNG